MDNPDTSNIGHTRRRKKITTQTNRKSNTDPTKIKKNTRKTQVLEKGKQFLLLLRHPYICYSKSV